MVAAPVTLPILSWAEAQTSPEAFIKRLQDALLTTGFFYLDDLKEVIPEWPEVWDQAFGTAREFFALEEKEKDKIAMVNSRHFRGYSRYGMEKTQGKVDHREQVDFGPETPSLSTATSPLPFSLYGPNQYPAEPPSFESAIKQLHNILVTVATQLLSLIAQSLTPEPDQLTSLFDVSSEGIPPYSRSKVVGYPPVPEGVEGLGVGGHKDGGGLTLLAQDEVGGLEVQAWNGEWINARPIKGVLVINIGQVIERMSASAYLATTHRVLPTRGSIHRISLPYFFSPRLNATLNPLLPSQLHPEILKRIEGRAEEVSVVKKGDLHEEVFGNAAWRGITRSHEDVWKRWYEGVDSVGGPTRD